MLRWIAFLAVVVGLIGRAGVSDAGWHRPIYLRGSGLTGDFGVSGFGRAVAALDDRVLVGVDNECPAAFVFEPAAGVVLKVLLEPDARACDSTAFGETVAAKDGVLAVAARNSQRVYLYGLTLPPTAAQPTVSGTPATP